MASEYYECPECGWVISFKFDGDKYVSLCPFCKNELEIDREEFNKNESEIYFKADF